MKGFCNVQKYTAEWSHTQTVISITRIVVYKLYLAILNTGMHAYLNFTIHTTCTITLASSRQPLKMNQKMNHKILV